MAQNKAPDFVSTEDKVKQDIYNFCEKNYLTYSAFCTKLELNKNILYPFMNGKRSITLSTLEKIERFIFDYDGKD